MKTLIAVGVAALLMLQAAGLDAVSASQDCTRFDILHIPKDPLA